MKHLLIMFAFILMTSFAFVSMPSMAWAEDKGGNQGENGSGGSGGSGGGEQKKTIQFFEAAQTKSTQIFKDTKTIIYIVGAFGLMVLAVGAIFGKMAWKTFAYLAIGLLLLAGAGGIIDYLVYGKNQGTFGTTLGDTLLN